jgi:hypothetical protein
MHYNVMAHIRQGLRRARDEGIKISLITDTSKTLVGGEKENSDNIVSVCCSSGAFCADAGEHFESNYVPKGTECSNPKHYHISPAMDVDASCAYLPENTWFINGQYHGQSYWDSYSRSLIMKLLFTNEISDVWSDPEFPQFEIAQNPADGVYAAFDSSVFGFVTGKDTALIVRSLSELHNISINSICISGADLKVDLDKCFLLKPGESTRVQLCGQLPEGERNLIMLKIDYTLFNRIPIKKSRTIEFTVMSDEFAQSVGILPEDLPAQSNTMSAQSIEKKPETVEYNFYAAPAVAEVNMQSPKAAPTVQIQAAVPADNPQTGSGSEIKLLVVLVAASTALAAAHIRKKKEDCSEFS